MSVTERINSIPKIDLMPEDEENEAGGADAGGDEGIGILDQAPSVDVAQFQKNLSGGTKLRVVVDG